MLGKIVRCVLPERPIVPDEVRQRATEEAVAFVAAALRSAPWHIRSGERVFRIALWLWLLPAAIRGPAATERALALFGVLSFSASIVRLYRSLALLAFLESDDVVRALGHVPMRERQATFRSLRVEAMKGQPS
jgi:hypothetical protein